jgi:hypothetical protein
MSYSIKISDTNKLFFHVQRNDGIWKNSPHFAFPKKMLGDLDTFKNFQIHPDDIWLVGFFKTGTTVAKELIWLLMNDLDFDRAKSVGLSKRFPYFEWVSIFLINNWSRSKVQCQKLSTFFSIFAIVILDNSNHFWREIQTLIENISRQNIFEKSRMTRGKNLQ